MTSDCPLSVGDSLAYHLGSKFSTRDQDNDRKITASCAVIRRGAWWYRNCYRSNLNGQYLRGNISGYGVEWYHWKGFRYSLRVTEMKIKPAFA